MRTGRYSTEYFPHGSAPYARKDDIKIMDMVALDKPWHVIADAMSSYRFADSVRERFAVLARAYDPRSFGDGKRNRMYPKHK